MNEPKQIQKLALTHFRKAEFGRVLEWPSDELSTNSRIIAVNHRCLWILPDSYVQRWTEIKLDVIPPFGANLWDAQASELTDWRTFEQKKVDSIVGRAFNTEVSPALWTESEQIKWQSGSWDELQQLFRWLLMLDPYFAGTTLPWIQIHFMPGIRVHVVSLGRNRIVSSNFRRWRILPRLFLNSNRPVLNDSVSAAIKAGEFGRMGKVWIIRIEPFSFHEQIEAKYALREWLEDKLSPTEINAILPRS